MLDSPVLQKNPVERKCQRLQCLFPYLWLQFTFPDGNGVPAHRSQFTLYSRVPLLIPPYLCHPEIPIRLRNLATLGTLNVITPLDFHLPFFTFHSFTFHLWLCHIVSVPEAAIHEYTRPVLSHHDIRFPWQSWMIQSITIPMTPKPATHHHLRLRIFAADGSHISVALLGGEGVHCFAQLLANYTEVHICTIYNGLYRWLHTPPSSQAQHYRWLAPRMKLFPQIQKTRGKTGCNCVPW